MTDPASAPATERPRAYRPDGYTDADQRADRAFRVGAAYGRDTERVRLLAAVEEWAKTTTAGAAEVADLRARLDSVDVPRT